MILYQLQQNLHKLENVMCKQCQLGKMTTSSFLNKTHTSNDILKLVRTDLCGPMRVERYDRDRYFILYIDDYSRMMTIIFMKLKSHAFDMFKWYIARVEKQTSKQLKCLRSDRSGEFIYVEFTKFCVKHGIKRQLSALRTPQHNGIVESRNLLIVDCARTILIE